MKIRAIILSALILCGISAVIMYSGPPSLYKKVLLSRKL